MFQNYLKIAFRSLQKQRFYAGINILGLSIGIACCLLISLFIWDELSYDQFNEKYDRIYRVNSDINFGGKREIYAVSQAPLAKSLREEIPEVETACRFRRWGDWLIRREGTIQNYKESAVVWADHEVFEVFTLPLLGGEKSTLLKEPNTLAMSESAAKRHFGELNPVGQNMVLGNDQVFKVAGVYKDIPQASHFHYDFLLSMEGLDEAKSPVWLSHNFNTYLVAKPGSDPKEIEKKLEVMFRKYAGPQVQKAVGVSIDDLEKQGSWARYRLMPLAGIHLRSNLIGEHEPNSDESYVWIFGAIAIFILVIACINFMNLATARSANRSKEVGMRKVLGSVKKQLVGQFLTEAVILSSIAFLLAIIMAMVAMPFFNQLTERKMHIPFGSPALWLALVLGALLTGLLAGSYPAFYLSSFRPIEVLKGQVQSNLKTGWLRNGLVVFQFAISTLLIVGTIVIYNQLNFMQNKRLGFDKEQVFILDDTYTLGEKFEGFKNEIEQMPEVKNVTATCYLPVNSCRSDQTVWVEGKNPDQSSVAIQTWEVDDQYLQTMGMELKEGRFLSRDFSTDSTAVVLNETAVKKYGFEEPIGQRLQTFTDRELQNSAVYTVVGVVKDFNFESLRDEIGPVSFFLDNRQNSMLSIRFDASASTSSFIKKIKDKWEAISPGQPFNYSFLDERFTRMYASEQRLGSIFIVFAGLAIFIACLGLLALAAYTAERRTKEIGVRKVLGATTTGIVGLLSRDFLKLVVAALAIASPLAYFFMKKWLQDFAYRVDISWEVFAIAGAIAVAVAFLTVSFQSVKAAMANPVKSLRSE
jgi:putative ABC transport system permease protein